MRRRSTDPRQLSLHNDVLHKVCVFYALMLSMATPEYSSATACRWARRADDLFVFFGRRQHPSARVRYSHDGLAEPMPASCFIGVGRMLALVMLMLYRIRPPSFWVHCSADRS